MLRWMYGVTLRDKKRTVELMNCLGVVSVELQEVISQGRLRWYGHVDIVERKDKCAWVSTCGE